MPGVERPARLGRPSQERELLPRQLGLIALGLALVATAGAHALFTYVLFDWQVPIWPSYLVATGLAWFLLGFAIVSASSVILVGGGALVAAFGALVMFQLWTGNSGFWYFSWPLLPLAAATAVYVFGTLRGDPRLGDYGLKAMLGLLYFFFACAALGWAYREFVDERVRFLQPSTVALIVGVVGAVFCLVGWLWSERPKSG